MVNEFVIEEKRYTSTEKPNAYVSYDQKFKLPDIIGLKRK